MLSTAIKTHYGVGWNSTTHGSFFFGLSLDTEAVMLAKLNQGTRGSQARLSICEAVRAKVIEEHPEISSEYVSFNDLAFVPLPNLAASTP